MDWSRLILGLLTIACSVPGLRRPEKDVSSVAGWRSRLDELEKGAPEAYFEERRQLEAYPPPKHATTTKVRVLSGIGFACGITLVIMAII